VGSVWRSWSQGEETLLQEEGTGVRVMDKVILHLDIPELKDNLVHKVWLIHHWVRVDDMDIRLSRMDWMHRTKNQPGVNMYRPAEVLRDSVPKDAVHVQAEDVVQADVDGDIRLGKVDSVHRIDIQRLGCTYWSTVLHADSVLAKDAVRVGAD